MAEPAKTDDALTLAVRDAFQRHLEKARAAALAKADPAAAESVRRSTLVPPPPANDPPRAAVPATARPAEIAPAARQPEPATPEPRARLQPPPVANGPLEDARVEAPQSARERLTIQPPRSRAAPSAESAPAMAVRAEATPLRLPVEPTREKAASTLGRVSMLFAAAIIGVAVVGAATWQFLNAPPGVAPAAPERPDAAAAPSAPAIDTGTASAPAATAAEPAAPAVVTRTVSTQAIMLDDIDIAVQEARERIAIGDVGMARLKLAAIQSDPRALFALAESYDPNVVTNPTLADPAISATYYEQAKAAGHAGANDRIARLRLTE